MPPRRKIVVKKPAHKAKAGKSCRTRSVTPPEPPPQKTRRQSDADVGDRQKTAKLRYMNRVSATNRDIAEGFAERVQAIDWDRRLACKDSLKLACETYFKPVFYLGWSDDQLRCIGKIETVCREGGMFTLAMPRAGGKTALCRGGLIWCTAYAYRRFPYLVGSTQPKAEQSLDALKMQWYRNSLLRQDFPEIAYPIYRLENRFHLARGQTFNGEPTHIEWGSDTVRYPCLTLPREIADVYLGNDPESVREVAPDVWVPAAAGITIGSAGIDGSIRGEAEVHPITLEQPRPDLVLLDDVQKDQKAESPAACDKIIRLLDGAIQNLSGPDSSIAALMPCTVIREGDVADTFLDPTKRPEWQGERCKLVLSWPEGITDYEITTETEAGRLWTEYAELRRKSYRLYEDIRLATEFYDKNRVKMDAGFRVSWKDRYSRKGVNAEISAQQYAMNLRLRSPDSFLPEFQNQGRRLYNEGESLITSEQIAERVTGLQRYQVPVDAHQLVAFIDVQNEILFYTVVACSPDFTGVISDYGTWPQVTTRYFTKGQAEGWSMLTSGFFKTYPQHRDKAARTGAGRVRAPFEAKIYWALGEAVKYLESLEFVRQDGYQTVVKLSRIGIDARWGQASDCIKRFIRDSNRPNLLVPCYGQGMPPSYRQFEEYERSRGWLFEDQVNPQVKEVKWVFKPGKDGQYHLLTDVNRLKDFLFARLASPLGGRGSVHLFADSPERHDMFANHLCSEYPEPKTDRGMTKNLWTPRDAKSDNDFLDCMVGCMALASSLGCAIQPSAGMTGKPASSAGPKRRISDRWSRKTSARP